MIRDREEVTIAISGEFPNGALLVGLSIVGDGLVGSPVTGILLTVIARDRVW